MSKFDVKIRDMEKRLAFFEFCYGYNCAKASKLRKKLEIYKQVAQMSHKEIGEQVSYSAGEIAKLKSGYYNQYTGVSAERRLLKVLTERIKADKKEKTQRSVCDLNGIDCYMERDGFEVEI